MRLVSGIRLFSFIYIFYVQYELKCKIMYSNNPIIPAHHKSANRCIID